MRALLEAQKTLFGVTGALTTAFPGGFWVEQAAPGTSMAYLIAHVISANTTTSYSSLYNEPQIQYTAFAAGLTAATTAIETFMSVWDTTLFNLATGKNFHMRRMHDALPLPGFPQPDQNGNNVFAVVATYAYGTN